MGDAHRCLAQQLSDTRRQLGDACRCLAQQTCIAQLMGDIRRCLADHLS